MACAGLEAEEDFGVFDAGAAPLRVVISASTTRRRLGIGRLCPRRRASCVQRIRFTPTRVSTTGHRHCRRRHSMLRLTLAVALAVPRRAVGAGVHSNAKYETIGYQVREASPPPPSPPPQPPLRPPPALRLTCVQLVEDKVESDSRMHPHQSELPTSPSCRARLPSSPANLLLAGCIPKSAPGEAAPKNHGEFGCFPGANVSS